MSQVTSYPHITSLMRATALALKSAVIPVLHFGHASQVPRTPI